MIRFFKHTTIGLLACTCLLPGLSQTGFAQKIQEPVHWDFSVKQIRKGSYEVLAKAQIASKWHIYAMNPGGDGELIGTQLQFENGLKILSGPKEVTPAHDEVILGEQVHLHSGKAEISATIQGKPGQKISGSVEHQACNDRMCMPPKTTKFSLTLP